jgi:hypothetical protein
LERLRSRNHRGIEPDVLRDTARKQHTDAAFGERIETDPVP